MINKYIADKKFYKKTLKVAIPLVFQQILSGAFGIVDTIMVSWINMVTAVGTAAQVDFLCGMMNYGIIGGSGIFTAQFYGAKDDNGLKKTFGLTIVLVCINTFLWLMISVFFKRQLLGFYIKDSLIIDNSIIYLDIVRFAMLFNGLNFAFSFTYRCLQKTKFSLFVSLIGMAINAILNYVLILGIGIFPKLGIKGAAIATLISAITTFIIYLSHAIKTKQPFIGSFNEMFGFSRNFVITVLKKIFPLMINESLFGVGSTLFIKAFGQLGTKSMDAYYVSNQIFNLFVYGVYGYGGAVQVLLGEKLGANKIEEAKKDSDHHLGLSFVLASILVVSMILLSKVFVLMFDIKDPIVYKLTIELLIVFAIKLSMRLFNFVNFCILRSGGDAKIIQFLDSGILWFVGLPLAFIGVNLLGITSISLVLLLTQFEQLIRLIFGLKRVKKYIWAKEITSFAR